MGVIIALVMSLIIAAEIEWTAVCPPEATQGAAGF
jgi:hypothetical protein